MPKANALFKTNKQLTTSKLNIQLFKCLDFSDVSLSSNASLTYS